MKMKKFFKWIILTIIFLIVLFCFLKITSYIMKPLKVDLMNIAGLYGEKKNSLDMVYIGGSASFVYWEPLRAFEKEGIASYDYGSNTIQAELYKTMIKEVLKTQNPELIVIDARAFQYREKDQPPTELAYRSALTGMPLSINKIQFIANNVKKNLKVDEDLSYYFDIMKYHRDIKDEPINEQILMAFKKYKNIYKGFYFVPKVGKIQSQYVKTEKKVAVAKETEEILIDLLEYMKTTKSNYLFIVSPYAEKENEKENFNYIADIIKQYGYNFVDSNDYYKEMQLDFDMDLYNASHVNIFGADKYTDFLTNYIKQNYSLPNRKEETDYKEWKKLLPGWNKKVKSVKKQITKLIKERK